MRSQIEIKAKIEEVIRTCKSKRDPTYQQYVVLVHKLHWDEAKYYMAEKDRTEERRLAWKETSHLEKKYIEQEIFEQMDISAMCFQANDAMGCIGSFLILIVLVWLLGPRHDQFMQQIMRLFVSHGSMERIESVFIEIANHVGIDWERLKLRYPREDKNIILPGDQGFNLPKA